MRFTLRAKQPFSLYSTVRSHGWYQMEPFQFDQETTTLSYVTQMGSGRVVELKVREASGGVGVSVGSEVSREEREELKKAVKWMLGLDQDFSDFYRLARSEPKLRGAEEKAQGRVLRSSTFFEDVVKTILTTNTLWAATKRMNSNIIEQFGSPLPDDSTRHAFPSAAQLAKIDEGTLREKTRLGYRAPYIVELARRTASGDLDLEAFKELDIPTLDLRKKLLAIKGIGSYAAAHLLLFLERYDFIAVDSWALKVGSYEWPDRKDFSKRDLEDAFSGWGAWKGLAYWFWDWAYFHKDGQ
jgi:3-methyladenine DNA glycosylase/8-oxoguanine DNA glycosylase